MVESPIVMALLWIAIAGLAAMAMMGLDKLLAVAGAPRVSERTFRVAAFLGGF